MSQKRFSIIVPIYNVEQYLEQCILSIKNQTFNDYELILVVDGSPDSSIDICRKYQNDNIVIIEKENGGLSSARNAGLQIASGEYVFFIDADDFLYDSNVLEKINEKIELSQPDLILINHCFLYNEKNYKFRKSSKGNIKKLIKSRIYKGCSWDKIVRRQILTENNMIFPVGKLCEDLYWCAKLLEVCAKYEIIQDPFYVYRQRENSITKTNLKKRYVDRFSEIKRIVESFKDNSLIIMYCALEYACIFKALPKNLTKEEYKDLMQYRWLLKRGKEFRCKILYFATKILNRKIILRIFGK